MWWGHFTNTGNAADPHTHSITTTRKNRDIKTCISTISIFKLSELIGILIVY